MIFAKKPKNWWRAVLGASLVSRRIGPGLKQQSPEQGYKICQILPKFNENLWVRPDPKF
jgi:hypothetical protein